MNVDHIHFYVPSAGQWRDWFVRVMGFHSLARGRDHHTETEIVGNEVGRAGPGRVIFVLSSPLDGGSPAARFLARHPPGAIDIAFAVEDLHSFSCRRGLSGPVREFTFPEGSLKIRTVMGGANFQHTLIERQGRTPILPGTVAVESLVLPSQDAGIVGIDHIVLNVFQGDLERAARWYERYLGFQKKQAFTIQTERSGLHSQVMVHPESGIQIPLNEPRDKHSQIQEFLEINKTTGVQHIALKTERIIETTVRLRKAGLSFLDVPKTYYRDSIDKHGSSFSPEEWRDMEEVGILIDVENPGSPDKNRDRPTLLQIFTKPIFERPTFFFELIERRGGVKGFGKGNFQALFETIEQDQIARIGSPPG